MIDLKEKNLAEINQYIATWDSKESPKPRNNYMFISYFIEFMRLRDSSHYEFDGDNNYCGHTCVIYSEPPAYCYGRTLEFELAYDRDFVKVFTANHNGFWVPEYIDLKGDQAGQMLDILFDKFKEWGGFKND